jgi:DNA (cytosine-5)-methyltransferase 1
MSRLRAIELFCGIGGFAQAVGERVEVVTAIDMSHHALATYAHNFPHPVAARTLESLPLRTLADLPADLWWLSPPCQPYTRRGRQRDAEDPRAQSLAALIDHLGAVLPPYVALENVPGFDGSQMQQRLLATLQRCGYTVQQWQLCPVEWGIPNRRRRYYLVAGRTRLQPPKRPRAIRRCLGEYLDEHPAASLALAAEQLQRYRPVLHIVRPDDREAIAACFTAAYGFSPVRSGSCLWAADGVRRFSVGEVQRLLGFPATFRFPGEISDRTAWRLLGNSLSVPVVRYVLSSIPELGADAT